MAKGLLIDISNAITDHNKADKSPSYPKKYELTVRWPGTVIEQNISVENAIKSAGLVFLQGEYKLPTGPI